MKSIVQRIRKQMPWRRQGVGLLCCLLSLIWFGIPSFHSFCHFADLPHQHPSGSAFSHDHSHGHDHSHDHDHHSHDHHSHAPPKNAFADNTKAGENAPHPDPELPHREPSDNEGPLFSWQLLESDFCCSAQNSLSLNQAFPVFDEPNCFSNGFFSSAELGTIGARGPPAPLESLFFLRV